jgi:hypothetical protein
MEENLKTKTAFESSGNSPTGRVKVSENGAPIQTGRGVEETKRRITEPFEKIRQHHAEPSLVSPRPQVEFAYTEQHEERFQSRVKRLTLAALFSSYIMKATHSRVIEITVPTESAEDLIAEALRGGQNGCTN